MSYIKEILANKKIQLDFEKSLMIQAIEQTANEVSPGTIATYDEVHKTFIYTPEISEEKRKIIKKLWIKNYKQIKKELMNQLNEEE